jgi:WD40-like Beta Propeller Repeat
MRRIAFALVGSFTAASIAAAQATPSTDIFVATLSIQNGKPVVGPLVNVTHRDGYDNQPSFTPDSRAVLFTSTHEDAQSDIYRLDLASRSISRVTNTTESEYSATVMPGGKRFSVIRVEPDSTQRLWSFAMNGRDPKVIMQTLNPVGYHTWIDANNLAMFVLGQPNALVHGNVRTGKSDTLARRVGRSLAPLPDKSGFSFVRISDSSSTLVAARWPGFATTDLVALPRGTQDIVWASNDVVVAGSGTKLVYWHRGATAWTDVGDYATAGLTDITRLALSPDGKWIAIVAVPKA